MFDEGGVFGGGEHVLFVMALGACFIVALWMVDGGKQEFPWLCCNNRERAIEGGGSCEGEGGSIHSFPWEKEGRGGYGELELGGGR